MLYVNYRSIKLDKKRLERGSLNLELPIYLKKVALNRRNYAIVNCHVYCHPSYWALGLRSKRRLNGGNNVNLCTSETLNFKSTLF